MLFVAEATGQAVAQRLVLPHRAAIAAVQSYLFCGMATFLGVTAPGSWLILAIRLQGTDSFQPVPLRVLDVAIWMRHRVTAYSLRLRRLDPIVVSAHAADRVRTIALSLCLTPRLEVVS